MGIRFNFAVCDLLFGCHLNYNTTFEAINHLILIGKWFLNKRSEVTVLHLSEYVPDIIIIRSFIKGK